jgi:hypothetical protein
MTHLRLIDQLPEPDDTSGQPSGNHQPRLAKTYPKPSEIMMADTPSALTEGTPGRGDRRGGRDCLFGV